MVSLELVAEHLQIFQDFLACLEVAHQVLADKLVLLQTLVIFLILCKALELRCHKKVPNQTEAPIKAFLKFFQVSVTSPIKWLERCNNLDKLPLKRLPSNNLNHKLLQLNQIMLTEISSVVLM